MGVLIVIIKDKSITGYDKNKSMYLGLINYMESLEDTELNLIFDKDEYSLIGEAV